MAALIAALAIAAGAQQATLPWYCARNFSVGQSQGLAVQVIDPDDRISLVDVQVWTAGSGGPRLRWGIPPGSRFASPIYFSFEMRIPPPSVPLWTRYWGDGRFLGQKLLVGPDLLQRVRGQQLWSVGTSDPQILAELMSSERWEVEIVNGAGATIARETVPMPPPPALRNAIGAEIDWLATVIRTRASPCHEEPNDLESI